MRFEDEFAAYCAAHGTPDRLELLLGDLNAVLRGKWLPGDQADKLSAGRVRLPLSTYAPNILGEEVEASGLGQVVGDPDGRLVPVDGTLCPVPWNMGDSAQVLVEMRDESGAISNLSPRQQLKKTLDRFGAKGLKPVVAMELEFYLILPRAEAEDPPLPPMRTPQTQNYDMDQLLRSEEVLQDILDAAAEQNIQTDTLIAEYGPGQFEVNFHHTGDVLRAADTAILFRRLVRGVATRHGLEATFMAKPYGEFPGNGMHIHVSMLNEAGENIFDSTGKPLVHGLGPELAEAVAGTLETIIDMQAIFAPHFNSLRRFGPGGFAPGAADWGIDHRGAAVRIPQMLGPGARLEHRIAGADANPYLALSAVLGGIEHGFEQKPDLPSPLDGDEGGEEGRFVTDWSVCVDNFERSPLAERLFGAAYRDIYVAVRRDEIAQLAAEISPMEYRAYLSRM